MTTDGQMVFRSQRGGSQLIEIQLIEIQLIEIRLIEIRLIETKLIELRVKTEIKLLITQLNKI